MKENLITIKGLRLEFHTYDGIVKALDGIDLEINRGETVGLVGETGCGKSVTALSVMRLIQEPGKIIGGEIWFEGKDLLKMSEKEIRQEIRGNKISMIFQEPMTSLNPVYTIGNQIGESFILHQKDELRKNINLKDLKFYYRIFSNIPLIKKFIEKKAMWKVAYKRAEEMLKIVGISDAHKVVNQYPHELSGGMRQRAMIAMALSCNPKLLIADEPTTALDVTIQAQILKLIDEIKEKTGSSVLLITHNLGVVAETCNKVGVMYAGNIVEFGDVKSIFKAPKHPYTKGLIKAIPKITEEIKKLDVIRGNVPNLIYPPPGCRFHPRCDFVLDICKTNKPLMVEEEKNHKVACFLFGKEEENA